MSFSLAFQLSELEQRVVEAESRAEDAEDKVRHEKKTRKKREKNETGIKVELIRRQIEVSSLQ